MRTVSGVFRIECDVFGKVSVHDSDYRSHVAHSICLPSQEERYSFLVVHESKVQ